MVTSAATVKSVWVRFSVWSKIFSNPLKYWNNALRTLSQVAGSISVGMKCQSQEEYMHRHVDIKRCHTRPATGKAFRKSMFTSKIPATNSVRDFQFQWNDDATPVSWRKQEAVNCDFNSGARNCWNFIECSSSLFALQPSS